ncbi:hypothetical protein F2Q69_00050805 [Brassica cretica]|uniref:Uncharacterized protein n=1 Tax=Brassica cretica TaxID=69181 RepID=A0A8S9PVY2_BRACR|nr:hypothetical protein F2Q69_00050805 [Brassica cretica]
MFDDDEKRVINGDRPFTKAKRSNCDVLDRNELQTYASLEKMLHKAIHVVRQLKKKGNTNTSSAPKQQIPDESCLQLTVLQPENPSSFELISQFEKDSENVLNKDEFSGPLNTLDIGAYDFGLGSFVRPSVLANLGRMDRPAHILILTANEPLGSDEPGR